MYSVKIYNKTCKTFINFIVPTWLVFYCDCSKYTANATATDRIAHDRSSPEALLQLSSSQKHMCPVPVPSIMHTWSTMNRLICNWDVHVLLMLSYAVRIEKIYKYNCCQITLHGGDLMFTAYQCPA